jgi:hypothetical protein
MKLDSTIVAAFPSAKTTKPAKSGGATVAPMAKKSAKRTKKPAKVVLDKRAQTATAQALRGWQAAEGKATGALIAVFLAVINGGQVTPDMLAKECPRIGESSRPVYASRFNLAGKVSKIIGADATRALIQTASDATGKAWENVIAALSNVRNEAAQGGVKLANDQQRASYVESAAAAVDSRNVARKAQKSATRAPSTAKLASAAIHAGNSHRDMAAALRLMSNQAHGRMTPPEGREDAHKKACAALAAAAEAWSVFK